MEKELLEAILATMESMQARIEAMEKTMEAAGLSLDSISGSSLDGNEDSEFAGFSTRHGEKLSPYTEFFSAIRGGEDLGRYAYDSAMASSGSEGYSEDGVVDSILADIVGLIEAVKGKIPEVAPALEAAEQAVAEAAVEKESAPGEEEDPSLTLDDDELQAIWDRSHGPGYVSR
jgi:hypothetical protein